MKKSNAMRLLDKLGAGYTIHTYSTADGAIDGLSVAGKTGREPGRVFKTLVLRGASGAIAVFCLPVAGELPLKEAARIMGEKKADLLPVGDLLSLTGYVRGGCSPIGMKRQYPTFLHPGARAYSTILVSGGRIGLQIELSPADLLRATGGSWMNDTETATSG